MGKSFTLIYVNQTDEYFADEFRIRKVANRSRLRIYTSKTKGITFHRLNPLTNQSLNTLTGGL